MRFNKEQIDVITHISLGIIYDIDVFLKVNCDFENSTAPGGFSGTFYDIKGGQKVFISKDPIELIAKVAAYIGVVEFLQNEKFIKVVKKRYDKRIVFPVFLKGPDGQISPFDQYYHLVQDVLDKQIIPLPELKLFIERKYLTLQEASYYDEKVDRKQAQKTTKIVASISILASLITIVTGIIFNTIDRRVTLVNPPRFSDTLNVMIVRPLIADSLVNPIEQDTLIQKPSETHDAK